MRRLLRFVIAAAILVAMQPTTAATSSLDAAKRQAALDAIASTIASRYVVESLRAPLVDALDAGRRAGRYDVPDAVTFAARVTEDLVAAGHDHHLYLRVDPDAHAALGRPGAAGPDDAYWRRRAMRGHHGLRELRVLPGNVRYLRIASFDWVSDATGQAYDDAMRFLKDGDAIVVDLRGNGGGDAAAVRYLVSHFVDDDTLLMTFREAGQPPEQSRALGWLPAGRLKGRPLYVLIDGRVASAAEEFAYHVEQFRLGTLVGMRTAGAANNNTLFPIDPGFVLSVSTGGPEHPVSHTNWEQRGISPTVEVRPDLALDTALERALGQIAATPDAALDVVRDARWAHDAVAARLAPPAVPPGSLHRYAGRFDGLAFVEENGTLWLERERRGRARLAPLTADGWFAIEGDDDLRLHATGSTVELLRKGDATPLVVPRAR